MWILEHFGKGSGADQVELPLGRSYKVVCGWLLLVLGLEALGRGSAANGGWLPLILGLGPFSGHRDVSCGHCHLCQSCSRLIEATFQANTDPSTYAFLGAT